MRGSLKTLIEILTRGPTLNTHDFSQNVYCLKTMNEKFLAGFVSLSDVGNSTAPPVDSNLRSPCKSPWRLGGKTEECVCVCILRLRSPSARRKYEAEEMQTSKLFSLSLWWSIDLYVGYWSDLYIQPEDLYPTRKRSDSSLYGRVRHFSFEN